MIFGTWSTQPIFGSYGLVTLLVLALLLLLWIRPDVDRLSLRRRRVLLVLRLVIVLLLVAALLRPTLTHTSQRPQTSTLVVLFDTSRSMQLPDAAGSLSRWEAQRNLLVSIDPVLAELNDKVEVHVYGFDTQLAPISRQDGTLAWPPEAAGSQTDIGTCLEDALRREAGKRLAAVILLSDGTQTAIAPPVDLLQPARELAAASCPLYTVAFGPAGDVNQARDVALEQLPEELSVFVKNELVIQGLARIRGYVNQDIPLRMRVVAADGSEESFGPINIRAREDNEQVAFRFAFTPQKAGRFRLLVSADPQPGEVVANNNILTSFLTVREGGLRVLYLEGEPRQEQKFIRWAIDASPDLELDFQWAPRRLRSKWPLPLGELLQPGRFDVILIGDLDSAALGEAQIHQLAEAVNAGTGLITLGGYHSFGPGGYRNTELRNVLPIEMDRLERQDFNAPEQERWHLPGPLPMRPARNHPLMRLGPDSDNAALWQRLAPLRGANRFTGVKNSPGVQVVAEGPGGEPLLVVGEYGRGRVVAFAGDSTWQWWRQGFQLEHKRFWRQMILWAARRDDQQDQHVWIELPQRRVLPGQRLAFTAGARDALGEPLSDVSLEATLIRPDGTQQSVPLSTDKNRSTGQLSGLSAPGNYELRVAARRGVEVIGNATADFEVLDRDLELSQPAADRDQLARLAALTAPAGGAAVPAEQLLELLEQLRQNPPQLIEEVLMSWQLGDTWWDSWLFVVTLVGLLGTEWLLRKKWGLV